MPTDSTRKKAGERKHLGVSFALPILLAGPAAWSLWSASETVPGNAVVSERADSAPGTLPFSGALAHGRVVAPSVDVEQPGGLVSPPRVLEAPSPTPDESVPRQVPAPPHSTQPPAQPRPVISLPRVEGDDAIAVVRDLIDAPLPEAIEESEGTDALTNLPA